MEDNESSLAKYEEAENEWDNVAEITPNFQDNANEDTSDDTKIVISPLTTVENIVDYINRSEMEEYLTKVRHGPDKKGFRKIFFLSAWSTIIAASSEADCETGSGNSIYRF